MSPDSDYSNCTLADSSVCVEFMTFTNVKNMQAEYIFHKILKKKCSTDHASIVRFNLSLETKMCLGRATS